MVRGKTHKIHKPALAIYSIIVGLAIKEALNSVIPHIISPPAETPGSTAADICQLITFLIVIIRFYLGSILFFEWAYFDESRKFKKGNFTLDFLLGIVHFILFSIWSFTVDTHSSSPIHFLIWLAVVLAYDVLWWGFTSLKRYDTARLMRLWMVINLGTIVIGVAVYFALSSSGLEQVYTEIAISFFVLFASLVDIVDMIMDGRLFDDRPAWLKRFV